jgi:2-keto-4-pentenoate hydratase
VVSAPLPPDQELIEAFYAARKSGEYFPLAWRGRLDIETAYRVQLGLIRLRAEREGVRRIGWKVGLTAPAIQAQFGFHEPVFACVLDEGRIASGHAFDFAQLIAPGFENEMCCVLGQDVAPGASLQQIRAAIATVHPALEITETRGEFTRHIALALADNAQQKAVVLGAGRTLDTVPDLSGVLARVFINEREVDSGRGSAVLGHPFHSIAWLAGKLPQFGERLRAGDLIMTGSFTRQFPIAAEDRIETVFEGVGSVSARF